MAIPSCISLVQGLLALQQPLRGLLTSGVQSREPAGSHVVSGGGCPKLENPKKAASTIRGMECQGMVKSWPWELPGPMTHFWGHSMQGGLGSSDPLCGQNPSFPCSGPLASPHVFCLANHA